MNRSRLLFIMKFLSLVAALSATGADVVVRDTIGIDGEHAAGRIGAWAFDVGAFYG